jgi:hypothetical protein
LIYRRNSVWIIAIFVAGYLAIVFEHSLHINKAAFSSSAPPLESL